MPQTETKFGTLFFEHFQLWNNIFSGKMSSVHHKTFKVNFAVLRKSIITQALNFVFDQKIAGKLQNVEVVKTNTLQNNTFFFKQHIGCSWLLSYIWYFHVPKVKQICLTQLHFKLTQADLGPSQHIRWKSLWNDFKLSAIN